MEAPDKFDNLELAPAAKPAPRPKAEPATPAVSSGGLKDVDAAEMPNSVDGPKDWAPPPEKPSARKARTQDVYNPPPEPEDPNAPSNDDKLWAGLAYLLFPMLIGALIGILTKPKSKYVKFHSVQMFMIGIPFYILLTFLSAVLIFINLFSMLQPFTYLIAPINGMLSVGGVIGAILLGVKAFQGDGVELPIIAKYAHQIADGKKTDAATVTASAAALAKPAAQPESDNEKKTDDARPAS